MTNEADSSPTGITKRPKRPLYKRKWPYIVLGVLTASVVCVGPWPTYSSHYAGSDYAEDTFARIEQLPAEAPTGPLRAGAASVEITPPVGEPLAGYGARSPKESDGVLDKLYAKAITLSNGHKTVTIVGGDILLILPELRDAILARTELPREDVYFTATHTHSGPGGYSSRWVDQLALGAYDEKILDRLAEKFAEAIRKSREGLEPAWMEMSRIRPAEDQVGRYVRNRLEPGASAHDAVWTILLRSATEKDRGKPIAALVTASAHPTCLGHENRKASADYPGLVQRRMEAQYACPLLFAAGAMGSMGPAEKAPRGPKRLAQVGQALTKALPDIEFSSATQPAETAASPVLPKEAFFVGTRQDLPLYSAIIEVDLPSQQFRLGDWFRLSPIAASYLHGRRTYIHVLRIGDAVLLGMPCDYSGELAMELEAWAKENACPMPIITSFNGDYIGYLLPERRYGSRSFEAREENLFGPWCGEYFNEIGRRVLSRLGSPERPGVPASQ